MKKVLLVVMLGFILSCNSQDTVSVKSGRPALIREGFLSKNSYEILCYGFPKDELQGIQRAQSAKRAAILNAYYFTKQRFNDTVKPDMDGKIKKITVDDDYAVIHFIINKKNLKTRLLK